MKRTLLIAETVDASMARLENKIPDRKQLYATRQLFFQTNHLSSCLWGV
jgi:hypothetical protein